MKIFHWCLSEHLPRYTWPGGTRTCRARLRRVWPQISTRVDCDTAAVQCQVGDVSELRAP